MRRFILTCAQNNTPLHTEVWENLLALRDYWGAEIGISRLSYSANAYLGARKVGTGGVDAGDWWDPRIAPYILDERVQLAPGLHWCGEINISPTAVRPLSGFETYTGRASGIFPHPKVALESIPAMRGEGAKINYTTGAITKINLIQAKAGQKAAFHHVFGALLVEVSTEGHWWCRQLNAEEGTWKIQDLDVVVENGKVITGHKVEAIVWGDFHTDQMDPEMRRLLIPTLAKLRPKYQIVHDLLDFRSRNHHDFNDPHLNYQKHVEGIENVEEEIRRAASILTMIDREGCKTIVVNSNHDGFFFRWLKDADYRKDPANARYFLEAQLEVYRSLERGDANFHLVEWAIRHAGCPEGVRLLRQDESFRVARGEVECGLHGDIGPNGQRGSPVNLSKLARKLMIAHGHYAWIRDQVYCVPTMSELTMGYTKGPSNWSHGFGLVYPNAKRALISCWEGRAWA